MCKWDKVPEAFSYLGFFLTIHKSARVILFFAKMKCFFSFNEFMLGKIVAYANMPEKLHRTFVLENVECSCHQFHKSILPRDIVCLYGSLKLVAILLLRYIPSVCCIFLLLELIC